MDDETRTLSQTLTAYQKICAGKIFPNILSQVDKTRQSFYHKNTDIISKKFGTNVDVTLFAQNISLAIANGGLPNDGRILVRHRILQTGRINFDEVLSVECKVVGYREGAKGRYLDSNTAFRRTNQTVPIRMATVHLLPYQEKPKHSKNYNPKGKDPTAGLTAIGSLNLTPDKVINYSKEVGNRIHSDLEFAKSRGYKFPIAQGLMQLTAIHGSIIEDGLPWEMDLDTHFLRPLYWDSTLTIYRDKLKTLYRCIDQDGNLTAESKLNHITTRDMEP